MVDVHSKDTRSKNMRAIKSKNTKPELLIRKALHARGYRYRLGGAALPGRPDLVLPKYKAAIFVHGCFWHGHNCRYFKVPATRTDFWLKKIETNKRRDARAIESLISLGWNVFIVWECTIRPSGLGAEAVVDQLTTSINQSLYSSEAVQVNLQ